MHICFVLELVWSLLIIHALCHLHLGMCMCVRVCACYYSQIPQYRPSYYKLMCVTAVYLTNTYNNIIVRHYYIVDTIDVGLYY